MHIDRCSCLSAESTVGTDLRVERSFNSINTDGEMSTNETIVVPANGAAAASHPSATTVEEIDEESDKESYEIFKEELTAFAVDLAKLVVRDGEGATKFVIIAVDMSIGVLCLEASL